jgi:uncharacterized membrane protein (DUF373 family)
VVHGIQSLIARSRSRRPPQYGYSPLFVPAVCSGHGKGLLMPDFASLKRQWGELKFYERFEFIASRIVMLFISIVIVYLMVLWVVDLFNELKLGIAFADAEALKDVFGSILTILILIEFNHSIALAITKRTGILQARFIVLIAILVIARKVILLDFATASFEQLIGISGIAIAFGVLYWLMSLGGSDLTAGRNSERPATPNK